MPSINLRDPGSIQFDTTGISGDVTNASNNGVPNDNFSFGDTISGLWNGILPVLQQGIQTYGQVEIAQMQADAQAKRNANAAINPSLGPNDPNAAQRTANQTLAQQWLPGTAQGNANFTRLVVVAVVLVFGVWLVRKLFK